jgi:quinolinate synthase
VARVKRDYADAMVTAHLEVPGEMFALGFEAQRQGRGVVGSTSNILDFIGTRVERAIADGEREPLRFVLGTESGMVTSIARSVQQRLKAAARAAGGTGLCAEIVFPVASEAIAQTDAPELPIVPGVAGGEGCTTAGGCASCPYMKMSSLDGLLALLRRMDGAGPTDLLPYAPKVYAERLDGHGIAELGGRSIVRMRELQRTGELPEELVAALTRGR